MQVLKASPSCYAACRGALGKVHVLLGHWNSAIQGRLLEIKFTRDGPDSSNSGGPRSLLS